MVSIRVEYWIFEYIENQYGSSTFSNSPLITYPLPSHNIPPVPPRNIPPAPLKGGVAERYQSEWSIGYLNMLKISLVVQRSPIPPLRGARGML